MALARDRSQLADGDHVEEIRLAQRNDVDGPGDVGFEAVVGCAADDECEGAAWVPVSNVSALPRALTGQLMHDLDVYCTVPGPHEDNGQEADAPGGRAADSPHPLTPAELPDTDEAVERKWPSQPHWRAQARPRRHRDLAPQVFAPVRTEPVPGRAAPLRGCRRGVRPGTGRP
ncbi:hypothetical protein [Streptomyces goshikiensis]|uniref:hypothetical protein n=1 Tax=Streptomyces goshikiensis TaxID=1942 RepID=UPI003819EBBE